MERIILGLGSNKGNKKKYLESAVSSLKKILDNISCSSIYQTSPQDYLEQDDFFNMVVIGYYKDSPELLLEQIQKIETENGRDRNREIAKGPRTLDIDILFFGNLNINYYNLIIPHPSIKKRAFVLVPLLELLPDFNGVGEDCCYKDILSTLQDQKVKKISN